MMVRPVSQATLFQTHGLPCLAPLQNLWRVAARALHWIASLFCPFNPRAEYQKLIQLHTPTLSHFQEAMKHPERNRFSNVLPNEPTRFQHPTSPTFYFNANWTLSKQAIACQGPLEREIEAFWEMVWQADVHVIAMLANPIEQGRDKCSTYWKPRFSLMGIRVAPPSERVVYTNDPIQIVERTITLRKGLATKTIIQYHLQNWPDFGVVDPKSLAKLIQLVREKNTKGPILAHCSAGIGRTGTFLAAFEGARQRTTNLFSIAAELRSPETGRVGLIQTAEQYALAHAATQLLRQAKNE